MAARRSTTPSPATLHLVSDDLLRCSAKGCRSTAVWQLLWNNPKLHPPERRKAWLACDEHRAHLADFLDARGFLRSTSPTPPTVGDGDSLQR